MCGTRDPDGVDRFLGYPVAYSDQMPSASRGNTSIIFGSFKSGYVIGDKGGTPLQLKIAWLMFALHGPILVIAFRRTDGRARRTEALQAYTVAAS